MKFVVTLTSRLIGRSSASGQLVIVVTSAYRVSDFYTIQYEISTHTSNSMPYNFLLVVCMFPNELFEYSEKALATIEVLHARAFYVDRRRRQSTLPL